MSLYGSTGCFRWTTIALLLAFLPAVSSWAESASETSLAGKNSLPHHFIRVSARVCCGAQPESETHYASLRAMGVQTIVSVDGMRPNVSTARKFGLRSIHIPIGYDGISADAGRDLAEVVRQTDGLIFVHCHHGRHRGPAAAAVTAMAAGQIDRVRADAILKQAGTSPQYSGLWRDVAAYTPAIDQGPASVLVETAETSLLVQSMSQLSQAIELIKQSHDFGWSVGSQDTVDSKVWVPSRSVVVSPGDAAVLIEEAFRESMRSTEVLSTPAMATAMKHSQILSQNLRQAIADQDWSAADLSLQRLTAACAQCHQHHRN